MEYGYRAVKNAQIKKQYDNWSGEVIYSQCEVCSMIVNFDIDECPHCEE